MSARRPTLRRRRPGQAAAAAAAAVAAASAGFLCSAAAAASQHQHHRYLMRPAFATHSCASMRPAPRLRNPRMRAGSSSTDTNSPEAPGAGGEVVVDDEAEGQTYAERQQAIFKLIREGNAAGGSLSWMDPSQVTAGLPRTRAKRPARSGNAAAGVPLTDKDREDMAMRAQLRQDKVAASYRKRQLRLVGDHVFLSLLGVGACWGFFSVTAAQSYALGAFFATLYLYLLSRYVETLGKEGGGGGGGSSRLVLSGALIWICGKNPNFSVAPAVLGFFSYQVATLLQALYYDADDSD